ncbi:TonB-dependent siderophore receptor [Pseudoalteromonas sp. SMS1]|uniref:TonB-dependent siderophore receptor n=1 Tax=Pseudoalteromonas sp. SMS1 TaxID=2908894 RepID=UPI001F2878F3|nr:TonB-dependent siderophore receptor [Pseudoalteromonas sp. SMS1]MCF2859557.1 TonB-dependent siderophore receptor [Pseudoalteromonas sp. SMS1]
MDNSNLHASLKKRPTLRLAPLALALTSVFTCSHSLADTSQKSVGEQSANDIERIYVTASTIGNYSDAATKSATKMILSLKETPQSVSVITQQQLEDWKSVNIKDILQHTTGVYASNSRSHDRPQFIVRGDAVNLIQIDGVQQFPGGRRADVNGDAIAYERVEILRGANGLMTGVGSPTATVNLVRKRAISKEFDGYVGVTTGRWNNNRVELDISAPLSIEGSIRGRIAAAHYDKDSFVDRYGQEKTSIYMTAEADVTESTLLRIGYEYADTASRGVINSHAAPYYFADGTLFNAKRSDTGLTAQNSTWPLEEKTYFTSVSHGFENGWQLNAIATYNTIDMQGGKLFFIYPADFDYYNQDGSTKLDHNFSAVISSSEDVQKTFDINIQGGFELLGQEHDLIIGFNNFDRDRTNIGNTHKQNEVTLGDISKVNYYTWTGDIPHYSFEDKDPNKLTNHKSSGAYIATRLSLTDNLKTIIGARLTNWEVINYGTDKTTNTIDYNKKSGFKVDNEITPYAGIIYDLGDDYSIYASYSDAFEPQNKYDKNDNLQKPIVGDSIEAGFKAELGLLNFSFAVFESNKKNLAVKDPSVNQPTPEGNTATILVDDAQTRGLEVELSGEVFPGLNIYTGYSYAKSEDQQGNQLKTEVPKQLFNLYTTYQPTDLIENLTIGLGVNWKDGYWVNSVRPTGVYDEFTAPWGELVYGNIPERERRDHGSITLFNLMARYDVTEQLSVSLNIDNLFDKSYHNAISTWDGSVTWGEPRNWKLSLRYDF